MLTATALTILAVQLAMNRGRLALDAAGGWSNRMELEQLTEDTLG
jgi:hypothetical protein